MHEPRFAVDAVLLAGGEGRRLGRRKETIELEGRTLLELQLDRWLPLFSRVWVSSRAPLAAPLPPEVGTILDPEGATSLIDVIPALLERVGRPLWILGVDLPLVPPEIPRTLVAAHAPGHCVFPRHDRGLEMLCGLYDPAGLGPIDRLRSRGERALHRIAGEAPCTLLDYPTDFPPLTGLAARLGPFFNVNRPEDLAALETARAEDER